MKREVKLATKEMKNEVLSLMEDKEYVEKHIVYNLVNKVNVRAGEIFDPVFGNDIGLVYRVVINNESGLVIREDLLSMFDGNIQKLRSIARKNTPVLRPAKLKGLKEMIYNLMDEPVPDDIDDFAYVLTNASGVNGAAAILYPEAINMIKEKIHGPFYVIPSSIHEVILLPADYGDPKDIKDMIMDVNADGIDPLDYLGDDPIPSTKILKALNDMAYKTIQENEEMINFQKMVISSLMDDIF